MLIDANKINIKPNPLDKENQKVLDKAILTPITPDWEEKEK